MALTPDTLSMVRDEVAAASSATVAEGVAGDAVDPSATILSAATAMAGNEECWRAASLAAGGKRSRNTTS